MTRRTAVLTVTTLLAALLAGCTDMGAPWPMTGGAGSQRAGLLGPGSPGRSRALGAVDPQLAFTTAKDVIGMYFDVASSDPDKGMIVCRPKPVQDQKERLLGASPTRQLASLQIVSGDGQVSVQVAVAVQQQGSNVYRTMHSNDSYSGVPNQTPAEIEGATTPEQNESWRTVGYAYDTERKILDDLFRRLHPEEPEPASKPSKE
jgi:hypothetical protein